MEAMNGNLLVVDDSSINRELLREMLRGAGYRVRVAGSGAEALEAVRSEAPETILLDVQMPGMSGYEVCERLKRDARWRSIPVIFISALDDVAEKVRGFQAGGADYVTKPFEPPEVLARVGSQLGLHRLQRELRERNVELQRRNEQLVLAQERTERVFLALSEALPGTVLDETYRLDLKIGEGGFGAVYRGEHLRLRRPVAIKVLRPSPAATGEDLARFRREGIAACRIAHPHAVEVLDFGVSSNGIAYLVMELLHGRTLSAMLMEEPVLPVGRCADLVVPVCDALNAAHAAGIVHRDVKPHNIFLHRNEGREVVKVVDFGIAKLMDDPADLAGEGVTQHGSLVGTPEYMAPERLLGRAYDHRSDIYSIGVVLYFMLSAKTPFGHENPPSMMEMVQSHLSAKPRPLQELARPRVASAVTSLVMRALENDPAHRPSLHEIAETLTTEARRVEGDEGEA
jgi:CheY-like chemotaxis protein